MIDIAYFTAFILVFIRLTSFFLAVPVIFPKALPNSIKILLILTLSYMIVPSLNYGNVGSINDSWTLILNCIAEVATGLTLGYITNLCFTAVSIAGNYLDMQAGFSMISMFDPTTSTNVTLIEKIFSMTATALFFAINGHHILIKAIINSFDRVSIGKFILNENTIMVVVKTFSEFFTIGMRIAIPITLVLVFTDLVLGMVARIIPQLNVMVLGLPIKILVSLGFISLTLPSIAKFFYSALDHIPSSIESIYHALPLLFIFSEEKTEEATGKKLSDAKNKGQVARSKEAAQGLTLFGIAIAIVVFGGFVISNLKSMVYLFLNGKIITEVNINSLKSLNMYSILKIGLAVGPFAITVLIVGVASNIMQTGFMLTLDPLKPNLNKINPIEGFKKMFSLRSVIDLLRNILIIIIVGYVGYKFMVNNINNLFLISTLNLNDILGAVGNLVLKVVFQIAIVIIVIAIIDYIYQKWQFMKDMKMSKQEVKEEYKQSEGNPELKAKRKQKMRELASRRMMAEVPKATVIVTNPTHISVALRYKDGENQAPKVVAKGSGLVALRIKEVAKENNIPIFENKPLARMINSEVEIGDEIPLEMYAAVAEVLAMVLKIGKN